MQAILHESLRVRPCLQLKMQMQLKPTPGRGTAIKTHGGDIKSTQYIRMFSAAEPVALSPANKTSGCMSVLPRTHLQPTLPHKDRYHHDNMLTRGQEIAVDVDLSKTVQMPLKPGEMSLHDIRIAHGSGPNSSDERRIGF